MNRKLHRAATLPFALAAALATPQALAASEVAPTNGADIRTVCPGIDAALQDSLAPAWSRVGSPGVVRVTMNVQGQKVTHVTTSGGPSPYSSQVKRAVANLACNGSGDAPQSLSFEIAFTGPTSG